MSKSSMLTSPSQAQSNSQSWQVIDVSVGLPARDELKLHLQVNDNGDIQVSKLSGIGCRELLQLLKDWRPKISGKLSDLTIPSGLGHAQILLREAILKAQGKWDFPFKEQELCHCRAVPTKLVDAAIVGGCHTTKAVSRATGASTSCGTCRSDVERILDYRLARNQG